MEKLSYIKCHVVDEGKVCILSEADRLVKEEIEHSMIVQYSTGKWGWFQIDFPCISTLVIKESGINHIISIGLHGEVHVASQKGMGTELIDDTNEGPEYRGDLRCGRIIEGSVYTSGMGRQVYKRRNDGQWERFDEGVVLPVGSSEIKGFNALDGFNSKEIYAVGYQGEIFWSDSKKWNQVDSPTNVALQSVACIPEKDVVYACGQVGVILKGRKGEWVSVEQELTTETFRCVESYNGRVFLATVEKLYELIDDELLEIDTGLNKKLTYGFLQANDGIMWSVGQRDLLYFDGDNWTEVIYE